MRVKHQGAVAVSFYYGGHAFTVGLNLVRIFGYCVSRFVYGRPKSPESAAVAKLHYKFFKFHYIRLFFSAARRFSDKLKTVYKFFKVVSPCHKVGVAIKTGGRRA